MYTVQCQMQTKNLQSLP